MMNKCHYIKSINHKVNSRLHFLRQLKRAAVSQDDMLQFYIGFIRPVQEYAVAAWHTGLTTELSDQLEITQKHALCIIYGWSSFNNCSYEQFCDELCISSLSARRDQLTTVVASSTTFFNQPAACITLLPHEGIILKQQS